MGNELRPEEESSLVKSTRKFPDNGKSKWGPCGGFVCWVCAVSKEKRPYRGSHPELFILRKFKQ